MLFETLAHAREQLMLSRLAEFAKAFYENPKNQKAYKTYKEETKAHKAVEKEFKKR